MRGTMSGKPQFESREEERIFRLAEGLLPDNSTRQIALQYLRYRTWPEDTVEHLMQALLISSGFRWKEQELAITLLGHFTLTTEEQAQVSPSLCRILTKKQWDNYILLYFTRVAMMGIITTPFVYLWTGIPWEAAGLIWTLLSSGLLWSLPMLPISSALEDTHLNRLRAAALRTCGRLQITGAIDMVAEMLFEGAGGQQTLGCLQVREAAAEALPSILAALTPEHYGRLPIEAMPKLCRTLYHPDDSLVMRVLEALEIVGDGRAVTDVERMVTRGRTPQLRTEAARILPVLKERQSRENAPFVLLRASAAPAETPDILLRPALNAPATEPQELLRASELRE
jgi:hypothetical protein